MATTAAEFTIGRLASETGCKIPTIRYYEQIGLLPKPGRSAGNTRLYGPPHKARLGFIQHCRELGFPQASIRGLLDLTDHPDRSCEAVTEIAAAHLADVNRRLASLSTLKDQLTNMIEACEGGRVTHCRIVETLADHSHGHCLGHDHGDKGRAERGN